MKYRNIGMRRLIAVLMGIFFLCTGLLKLGDPVGTMLIVTEYCKFFHLQFLLPAANVILSAVQPETVAHRAADSDGED